MMNNNIFTNSMFDTWEQCPKKYFYKYVKKIVIPEKDSQYKLGREVHALINYKLNGIDTSPMEKNADKETLTHFYSVLAHEVMQKEYFHSEWGFNVNVKNTNNILNGRIDAIFFDEENNKYIIADWKTGSKIPDNPQFSNQAKIYLYSFFKASKNLGLDIKPENISFSFIQTPSLKTSSLNFSEELFEEFEQEFLSKINSINAYDDNYEIKPQKHCDFCMYKYICFKNNQA